MKKLVFLFGAFVFLSDCVANTGRRPPSPNASEILIPVGRAGQTISLLELSQISIHDFQTLSDKRLGIVEKIAFKEAQKKLRHNINADGTLDKRFLRKLTKAGDGSKGFHAGGFFLGFLLPVLGVVIAYLIEDDKKRHRVTWAWIGFAAFLVVFIVIMGASTVSYF